ncbi:unnamed protein product [Peniophora sp. CBMAI 1063]|nr:unnamed protein product [Peniophora sp. CBMAI 1063]
MNVGVRAAILSCHRSGALLWQGRSAFHPVHLPGRHSSLELHRRHHTRTPSRTRQLSTLTGEGSITATTALTVLVGLPISLWAYKCLMMYIFQRKIIYMGYIPMGARTETLKDVPIPSNVHAERIAVSGERKASLSGVLVWHKSRGEALPKPTTVMVYFQGNAGNTLQRLPKFAALLDAAPSTLILAVAPRSFWSSGGGRPTQAGLTADYLRLLAYASERFPDARVIVYGHSLGASIATCVLAATPAPQVHSLVLENSFASIPDMVRALYPERWLPYHYMGDLVWDTWDAVGAAGASKPDSALARVIKTQRMVVLVSEKDELVPPSMGRAIAEKAGDGARVVSVRGALHETGWTRKQWKDEMGRWDERRRHRGAVQQTSHRLLPPSQFFSTSFDSPYIMKFWVAITALATSANATSILPRAAASNASLSIVQPTYLQDIGSSGDQFEIVLKESYNSANYNVTEVSVVIGINPCGDDDICGDAPTQAWGDVLYNGRITGGELSVKATVPENFLDGRADFHVYHVAVTRGSPTESVKLFTEIQQVTVIVSP